VIEGLVAYHECRGKNLGKRNFGLNRIDILCFFADGEENVGSVIFTSAGGKKAPY